MDEYLGLLAEAGLELAVRSTVLRSGIDEDAGSSGTSALLPADRWTLRRHHSARTTAGGSGLRPPGAN